MERIKSLRKAHGITMKKLGELIGVAESTVSLYESGKRRPDYATLLKISHIFNVTVDYILENDYSAISKESIKIPVLGEVHAGLPVEAVQDILDWEEISEDMASQGELFGLKVKGDSMEPKISEGDVVIVRKQSTAETGDTVIALVGGDEATIKKLRILDSGLMLIPTNPAYDPIPFTKEEIISKPVTIIGKVIELRAKF